MSDDIMDQRHQQHAARSCAHCNGESHRAQQQGRHQPQYHGGQQQQRGRADERGKSPADAMTDYAR
jgi:hypothetical protein